MLRLRFAPIFLLSCLALPFPSAAASAPQTTHWQEAEIVSRKTIVPGHHSFQTHYVYCIKSGPVQYKARFDKPLSVALYSPVKIAVKRRHILIQDADGSEHKAGILVKTDTALRQ